MNKHILIHEIQAKYLPKGILKAGELLLKPSDAIQLLGELEHANIGVLGINVWYTINDLYAEDLSGMDLSYLLNSSNWIHESIQISKKFILEQLTENIERVSFIFEDRFY
jgi:hypothetical protein